MSLDQIMEWVEHFGSAKASYAVAHAAHEPKAAQEFASEAMTALLKVRAAVEQLRGERDAARARVHLGHSGEYVTCLRRPCIGWVAHDRADAATSTSEAHRD